MTFFQDIVEFAKAIPGFSSVQSEDQLVLVKAGSDLFARQHEGKTPKDLADFVNEQEMVAFLGACETGQVSDLAD